MKRSNSVLTLFINFTTENFCVSMKDSRVTLMAMLTGLGDADHALDVTDGDGHGTCSFKDFLIFADFKNILNILTCSHELPPKLGVHLGHLLLVHLVKFGLDSSRSWGIFCSPVWFCSRRAELRSSSCCCGRHQWRGDAISCGLQQPICQNKTFKNLPSHAFILFSLNTWQDVHLGQDQKCPQRCTGCRTSTG